jgi:hypothetical protein
MTFDSNGISRPEEAQMIIWTDDES